LIKPGDAMPAIQLANESGKLARLQDGFGDALTVVLFWNSRLAFAREQYRRLAYEVVEPFGGLGVKVVAINTGDDPKGVAQLMIKSGGPLINLFDRDGRALAMVASDKLPRTYLLDASGRVVWMDLEYSRGTRRELTNAIRYHLKLET
jgi:peroxiredoxin